MTNSKHFVEEKHRDSKYEMKDRICHPYNLPSCGQLLSYWHHERKAPPIKDTWKPCHDLVLAKEEEAALAKRRFDPNLALIKQLRGQGAQNFSRMRYVRDIRSLAKLRLIVGQKRDGCIQLDQQLDIEKNKYMEIKHQYKICVKALEQFFERDHEESMRILSQAEAEQAYTAELSEQRDELSRRYGQARLEVYHWEEAWRTVKACHRFIYKVSPLGPSSPDDKDSLIASGEHVDSPTPNYSENSDNLAHTTSLDSLIAAFEKESMMLSISPNKTTPKDLGLLEPEDLPRLFRAIEVQNLNALIHLESIGGPMADMVARIEDAEVNVSHEINDVLDGIRQLEASIEREERRAERLERQSERLIQSSFRALICSEDVLQARILVEDAYETCVVKNEAGLGPLAMAQALEKTYEQLSADLDRLPRQVVAACEREGFQQEMRANREAEDAASKFELMTRLLGALRRIMEPLEPKRRMLMRRSPPKTKKKSKSQTNEAAEVAAAREAARQILFGNLCKPYNKDKGGDSGSED